MNGQFRESDAQILSNIIQFANQRYLRQSRINKKSSFNILRVLSAYKQTSEQYMGRKQQIYNWIIYITKNFNPQTYKQWTNAIVQISQVSRKSSKSLISHKGSGYPYVMNKTVNEFYHHPDNSNCEPVNMSMNPHGTQMSGYLVKDFALRNASKQLRYHSNEDYRQLAPPRSSKMHYISFEPQHQNKQNLNSQNTNKSDQMKIDHYNQPTRTPCEQSFIHNLPMSYGSPFVFSKITNNTKDITQIEDEEEQSQQWAIMKTRADVFHQINLKMKSFSALLANFQAFQIFQQLHKKTKKFQKGLYYSRFMNCLQSYIHLKDQRKFIFNKADKFYQEKLTKKGFKILYVLYQLKIHDPNRKSIEINKFNPINYQFLLSIIFSSSMSENQFNQQKDTPKSLRHKSRHFQRVEDFEKMEIISEYFSCNMKLNKQQIQKLFIMHNKARKMKILKILKQNVRNFKAQNEKTNIMLKKSTIKDFLKVHKIIFHNKARILLMKTNKNIKIKHKCFKALLQIILSKKIYAKRQQYLTNKHNHMIMKNLLTFWKQRNDQKKLKKLSIQTRIQKSTIAISSLICKKTLRQIAAYYYDIKQKQQQQFEKNNTDKCKKIFQFLKNRVNERRIHLKIKQSKQTNTKKSLFSKWKKVYRINEAIYKISKLINKATFSQIKTQIKLQFNQNQLNTQIKNKLYKRGIKQLRISFLLDKQLLENNLKKAKKFILLSQTEIFLKICNNNLALKKSQQIQSEIKKKIKILEQKIDSNKFRYFYSILKNRKNQIKAYENKQKILRQVMGIRQIKTNQYYIQNSQQTQFLCKTFVRCHKIMKKQVLTQLQKNLSHNFNVHRLDEKLRLYRNNFLKKKLTQWRKQSQLNKTQKIVRLKSLQNIKKNILSHLKEGFEKSEQQYQKSIQKHNKLLCFKTLLSLAKSVIYSRGLEKNLQQSLYKNKKNVEGNIFIGNLKQNMQFKQKKQLIRKLNLFSTLKTAKIQKCSLKGKSIELQKYIKRNQIQKLRKYKHMKIYCNLAKQFEDESYKRFAIMKVNRAVFRHILRKKQLFMAIKFKATQLCKLSFKCLFLNINNTDNKQSGGQSRTRKFRLHEHISTQYSSL